MELGIDDYHICCARGFFVSVSVPKLNVCFDLGNNERKTKEISWVFLSSLSFDRVSGVFAAGYYRQRGKKLHVGIAEEYIERVLKVATRFTAMCGQHCDVECTSLVDGAEMPIKRSWCVRPIQLSSGRFSFILQRDAVCMRSRTPRADCTGETASDSSESSEARSDDPLRKKEACMGYTGRITLEEFISHPDFRFCRTLFVELDCSAEPSHTVPELKGCDGSNWGELFPNEYVVFHSFSGSADVFARFLAERFVDGSISRCYLGIDASIIPVSAYLR